MCTWHSPDRFVPGSLTYPRDNPINGPYGIASSVRAGRLIASLLSVGSRSALQYVTGLVRPSLRSFDSPCPTSRSTAAARARSPILRA